jgi:glycosyltransferase involved in cell wall biosynthesis
MASVARLDPVAKGQDLLFHFLARPAWRKRAVELNLYGTGPCAQGMRRLAEHLQLKAVHFHGFIEDVSVIWEQNHLHLLPSRIEGLPLSLVEAMWCGRPSVVTDIAGNTEVCDHGKTGFVAAAPAPEIFAQTMEEAWNRRGEWRKMGQAARLRAEQILPKDPVGQFSQQLISCAKN